MPTPPAPFTLCFRAAGVGVEVGWDDEALSEPLHAVLSYYGFDPPGAEPPALHLRLSTGGAPLAVPPGAELLGQSAEGLAFHRLGETLYLGFRRSVVRIAPRAGLAHGTLDPAGERHGDVTGDDLRDALLFCFCHYGLLTLLYFRGVRTMHAACLTRHGHGVLFPGVSDSGKSTLALRLVEQGWGYLSDDSVLLRAGAAGIEASPLRQDFCLDPDAADVFPQAPPHWQPHLADRRKRRLRIRSLYPDRAASACTPRTLVFPQVVAGAARSTLVPLSPKAAFLRLLQHGGALAVLDAATASVHLDELKRLAHQASSYALLAGRDLLEDRTAAADLLDGVVGP